MASLAHLLESPALGPLLVYLVRPRGLVNAERVALVEDLPDLRVVEPGAIVLLTHAASSAAGTYRFDIALRMARSREVAAIVLSGPDVTRITPTAVAIADRAGVAILGTRPDADLAQLAIAIGRELAGGADVALMRTHTAVRAVEAHPADGRPEALVERAGAALGVPISMVGKQPANGVQAPVVVDDRVEAWLSAAPQSGDLGLGLEIVLHVAAAGAGQALTAAQRARELPIQSRDEVLSELLSAPVSGRERLTYRARALGMPIDGWHVAVHLELEELTDPVADADVAAQGRLQLALAVIAEAGAAGGTWHTARSGLAPVLVRTYAEDPGAGASGAVARIMDGALERARHRRPETLLRCGVGAAHPGTDGLLASVGEARAAAVAARVSGHGGGAVAFDSVGLRRTLVEWYASDTARDAVATVLAPLEDLGGARAERLIRTLHVYLDEQGSLTRTADTLSLHRNAVSYRMNQVFSLLEVDPDNADDRLLLQLACRARALSR